MYKKINQSYVCPKRNIYDNPAYGHLPLKEAPPALPMQLFQLTAPNGRPYPVQRYHPPYCECITCKTCA
jgi:hypothetical protein